MLPSGVIWGARGGKRGNQQRGATLSLQEPFHFRHPFILHFHSMAKAMRRKTNTKGLDKKAMGKAPATNCQAMEARMVVMIAPRNPKLKNSCIPSETPKSTRLGRTMLSIQQLFHANTKISTISSQDGWLLFDELDHIRFDAKTRGPSTVRQGQEPRFYRETSQSEPNQIYILVSQTRSFR